MSGLISWAVRQHIPNLNIFPGQVSQSVKHAVKRLESHLFTSVVVHRVNRTHCQPRALRQGVARDFTLVKNRLQVPVDHAYRVSLNHKSQYSLCLVYILTPYYNGVMKQVVSRTQVLELAVPVQQVPIRGIYFLLFENAVVYVGQSANCLNRIHLHTAMGKEFDSFSIVEVKDGNLNDIEAENILFHEPKYNGLPPSNSLFTSAHVAKQRYGVSKAAINQAVKLGCLHPRLYGSSIYYWIAELDLVFGTVK